MTQDKDPIAEREAKIAALQLQVWSANNDGARRKATDALAAMARDPAPQDGDAKLRDLRELVVQMPIGAFQGTTRMRLIDEIDRLLSKPSEPAPSTTNTLKVMQTGEHFCETQCEVRKDYRSGSAKLVTKVAAMEADLADIRADNARLQADLAAARADQAAMARRELQAEIDRCENAAQHWQGSADAELDQRAKGRLESRVDQLRGVAHHMKERLAALPAQQPEPKPDAAKKPPPMTDEEREAQRQSWAKGELAISAAEKAEGRNTVLMKPDAATRDGDEVLRRFVADVSKPVAYMTQDLVLAELCRRELARKPHDQS